MNQYEKDSIKPMYAFIIVLLGFILTAIVENL
jgi:hypothetical protein